MRINKTFLFEKIQTHDVVKLQAINLPRPQVLSAKVQRIYSARKGIHPSCLDTEIEFVRSPGTWGSVPLEVGEEAIVFISLISGCFYEDAWHGHMLVEEINGERYAIFPHRELWLSNEVPDSIRTHSRPDPKRSKTSAIHLETLETYLLDLIEKTDERANSILNSTRR